MHMPHVHVSKMIFDFKAKVFGLLLLAMIEQQINLPTLNI